MSVKLTTFLKEFRKAANAYADVQAKRICDLEHAFATVTAQRDSLIKAVEPLKYWRDISECDCSSPLPQGGCLRCDLNRILEIANPNEP
jgi:hypothetical protein